MNGQNGGRQLRFRFAQSPSTGMSTSSGTSRSRPTLRVQKRITSKAAGQDNDGSGRQLSIALSPSRSTKILKKPMPEQPILTQDTTFSFTKLMSILESNNYPDHAVGFIETAYRFVEKICSKMSLRENGEPAIVHPLAPAIRAARMGMDAAFICACLLHDVIEDTNKRKADENSILPDQILNLFGPHPLAQECGRDTLEWVLIVTKPKFFEKEKRWIFPTSDEFFRRDNDFYREVERNISKKAETALYDARSEVYYEVVENSGIRGILAKSLDNAHNLETLLGLPKSKQMKDLRTMTRYVMRHSAILYIEADVNHLKQLSFNLGIDIERSVKPLVPTTQVITFKLRDRLDAKALLKHPDPKYAYISVYGSNHLVALAMDCVEVGLPPRIGLNYVPLLTNYLGHGFHVTPEESAVPITSPLHESIVKISGFTDKDARSKVIQSSQVAPRYFDLLDEKGKIIASVSLASLAKRDVRLGPHTEELLAKAEERYDLLKQLLRTFYQDEIYPILEKHEVNNPKE